ncbi:hypothetical protein ACLOJK_027996 [Asimina triloba]
MEVVEIADFLGRRNCRRVCSMSRAWEGGVIYIERQARNYLCRRISAVYVGHVAASRVLQLLKGGGVAAFARLMVDASRFSIHAVHLPKRASRIADVSGTTFFGIVSTLASGEKYNFFI